MTIPIRRNRNSGDSVAPKKRSADEMLLDAALRSDVSAMKEALRAGAVVDAVAVDDRGWTPLMYCVSNGCVDGVCLLADEGADVLAKNEDGYSAALLAVYGGHTEIFVELVERRGADAAEPENSGRRIFDRGFFPNSILADLYLSSIVEAAADMALSGTGGEKLAEAICPLIEGESDFSHLPRIADAIEKWKMAAIAIPAVMRSIDERDESFEPCL